MTSDEELRLECLRLAAKHGSAGGEQDVHTAKLYYDFISGMQEVGGARKAEDQLAAILILAEALHLPVKECDRSQEQSG